MRVIVPISVGGLGALVHAMGAARDPADARAPGVPGRGEPPPAAAARGAAAAAAVARPGAPARIRGAHDAAHAGRAGAVARLHLHLRDAGRQEPARRACCWCRCSTSCSRCRSSASSRSPSCSSCRWRPAACSGAEFAAIFAIFTSQAWNMAFSFYQSLRTRAGRAGRGGAQLSGCSPWMRFWRAGGAVRDAAAHLEHDDVDVGRLVLRGGLGGDQRRQHHGRRCRASAPTSRSRSSSATSAPIGWAIARHAGRHPALRPAAVPAAGRLGRPVPLRAGGRASLPPRSWALDDAAPLAAGRPC